MNNVVTVPFRREYLGEMASKIEAVVYEYAGRGLGGVGMNVQ